MSSCCGAQALESEEKVESLKVRQTKNFCSNCEDYVAANRGKRWVVVSCEGACLRGEISRRVADRICHGLLPDETVRICQGSALSKDGGQRELVLEARNLVFLEGCHVECASRLFHGFASAGNRTVIHTDRLADFDRSLFGSNEMPSEQIDRIAQSVAAAIVETKLKQGSAPC